MSPSGSAPLPERFPVFPLTGALLLPHGRLPLNIFEPRYCAMIEDALGAGRHIAMIQPDAAAPRGQTGPALHRVGCLGRLVSFSETEDGRYLITLMGVIRFSVAEELDMARGYRVVRGNFGAFTDDLHLPDPEPGPATPDREALLAALRGYFTQAGIDANWVALTQMSDAALVVTLSMGCPFEPLEKQALLEAPSARDRAETLLALLRIHMHDGNDRGATDPARRPS